MKYLYKILRLFFCPHKYGKITHEIKVYEDGDNSKIPNFIKYIKECKYCGRMKEFKSL